MESVGILQRSAAGSPAVTPGWAWPERTSWKIQRMGRKEGQVGVTQEGAQQRALMTWGEEVRVFEQMHTSQHSALNTNLLFPLVSFNGSPHPWNKQKTKPNTIAVTYCWCFRSPHYYGNTNLRTGWWRSNLTETERRRTVPSFIQGRFWHHLPLQHPEPCPPIRERHRRKLLFFNFPLLVYCSKVAMRGKREGGLDKQKTRNQWMAEGPGARHLRHYFCRCWQKTRQQTFYLIVFKNRISINLNSD